jgi:hypothetical protein
LLFQLTARFNQLLLHTATWQISRRFVQRGAPWISRCTGRT